jgi:ribosome-binding factor A
MTTFRIERINRELLRELTELIRTRVKDDRAQRAILTAVSCTRDLGFARVWFTLIDPAEKEEVIAALDAAKGLLRGAIGRQMRLRVVPEFRFLFDETEAKARRIDELLARLGSSPVATTGSSDEGEDEPGEESDPSGEGEA